MYWQYLSIVNQKKKFATPTLTSQATHKLKKIVSMNTDCSETIKDREFDFRFRFRFVRHANSNSHKPPKPVAPTILLLDNKF